MAEPKEIRPGRGRLVFGCVLLVLSIVPWVVAPFTALIGLPTAQVASVVAALLIGAEVIGAIAVAVLGREAYLRITGRLRRSNRDTRQAPTFRIPDVREKETSDG